MVLDTITRVCTLIAILATAVVYGADVFCAIVLRPALAAIDDRALLSVTGNVHRYGDRRMPIPGALGIAATAVAVVLFALNAQWVQAGATGCALVLLLTWITLYTRISAPINKQLTAALDADRLLPNTRALQAQWDRIIGLRALLQGLALLALCVVL